MIGAYQKLVCRLVSFHRMVWCIGTRVLPSPKERKKTSVARSHALVVVIIRLHRHRIRPRFRLRNRQYGSWGLGLQGVSLFLQKLIHGRHCLKIGVARVDVRDLDVHKILHHLVCWLQTLAQHLFHNFVDLLLQKREARELLKQERKKR